MTEDLLNAKTVWVSLIDEHRNESERTISETILNHQLFTEVSSITMATDYHSAALLFSFSVKMQVNSASLDICGIYLQTYFKIWTLYLAYILVFTV